MNVERICANHKGVPSFTFSSGAAITNFLNYWRVVTRGKARREEKGEGWAPAMSAEEEDEEGCGNEGKVLKT